MAGYIRLHRQFLEWEWYSDINVSRLFLHLLLKVNYETKRWQGVEIYPGQIVTSSFHLSAETGLTRQQVRTALDKLKKTGEINQRTTSQYTIITILNWDKWQKDNQQITNEQPTDNQQITTTKKREEIKKEKNIYSPNFSFSKDFLEWFALYPRKESKKKAYEAYQKALKDGATIEQLLDGVKGYNAHITEIQQERQFIKMPTTWLNQGCWEDIYVKPKVKNILDGIIK